MFLQDDIKAIQFKQINNINFTDLQFLTKDCEDRLGCTASGEQSIVDHAFFREMDWVKLEARQIEPPFKPIIVRETMYLLYPALYMINHLFFYLLIYLCTLSVLLMSVTS